MAVGGGRWVAVLHTVVLRLPRRRAAPCGCGSDSFRNSSFPLVDKGKLIPSTVGGRCLSGAMTTIQHTIPTGRRPGLGEVLDRARQALLDRRRADADLLMAAVDWAEAHPATTSHEVAGWGEPDLYGEGFLPLAGEGAPLVAEF